MSIQVFVTDSLASWTNSYFVATADVARCESSRSTWLNVLEHLVPRPGGGPTASTARPGAFPLQSILVNVHTGGAV